jgi:hypothetical protein
MPLIGQMKYKDLAPDAQAAAVRDVADDRGISENVARALCEDECFLFDLDGKLESFLRMAVRKPDPLAAKIHAADFAFVHQMTARATALRDANPTGFVLATVDDLCNPMRRTAFDDIHVDRLCESPIVIESREEAERAADAWNARLPEQFRDTLSIAALSTEAWCEAFMDTLDWSLIHEEAA